MSEFFRKPIVKTLMLKGEKGDTGDSDYQPAVDALGKRIDNLILSSGTESSAEVVDARTGYDGTAYPTLGTAIRKQVSELKENSKKYIAELNDKKITKFYTSNLGETNLSDSDKGKIQDMILYGKSLQNGTPTPDNPVEIQSVVNPKLSVCGKNLFNATLQTTTKNGVTCTNNGDGTYTLNGTASDNCTFSIGLYTTNNVKPSFKFIGCPKGGSESTYYVETSGFGKDVGNGVTANYNNDYKSEYCIAINSGTTCNNLVFKPMITTDLSATYDDFEPYKEQSATLPYTLNAIPVSSGGNIEIDGQQYIADYVDIENKKLHRYVDKCDLGSLDWSINNSSLNIFNRYYDEGQNPRNNSIKANILCSNYLSSYYYLNGIYMNDKNIAYNQNNIFIRDSSYTDITALKNDLSGVMMYFILNTPTITDLTDEEVQAFKDLHTYYPTTNIINSSDQLDGFTTFNYPVSLKNGWEYVKQQIGDTREYIYDMELQSAEAFVNSEYAVTLTELGV